MRSGDLVITRSGNQWIAVFELDLSGVRGMADGTYQFCIRDVDGSDGMEVIYTALPAGDLRIWRHGDLKRNSLRLIGRRCWADVHDDDDAWITILQQHDGKFAARWRWELVMAAMRGSPLPVARQVNWREARPEEI